MIKRFIAWICILTITLANCIAFAGVPEKLIVSTDIVNNKIAIYVDGGTSHLGFSGTTPIIVEGSRDVGGGLFNDKPCDAFFSTYNADEYWYAFNKIRTFDSDEFLDIDPYNIMEYEKEKCGGNIPDWYSQEKTSTYLKDLFLIAFIVKMAGASDISLESSKFSLLDTIISTYTPGKLFFNALGAMNSSFAGNSNLSEVRNTLDRLTNIKKEDLVNEFTDKLILDKYVSKITTETIHSMEYDDVEKMLYALSWSEIQKHPIYDVIRKELNATTSDQKQLLTNYWDSVKINLNTISPSIKTDKLMQLSAIVLGRGSVFSISKNSIYSMELITPQSGVLPNTNSKISAEQLAFDTMNSIRNLEQGASIMDQQLTTISFRLQYHYYALQSKSIAIPDIETINYLSETENGSPFSRVFPPIDLSNIGIIDGKQYVLFMNVVNELPLFRQILIESGLSNINNEAMLPAEIIRNARYLRQMKGAVSFLESLPYIDIKEVTRFWYEKDADRGISLEDLFIKVQELGIDDEVLDNDITVEDQHPLSQYFDMDANKLNLYLRMGIAQSALFTPLQTNVYEPYAYSQIDNENFFKDMHAVWGYHRKVLYIDTALASAVNLHNTGKTGKLRPATLKDLLSPEKDIVLYTDTSFYNENKLESLENQIVNSYDSAKDKIIDTVGTAQEVVDATQGKWDKVIIRETGRVTNVIAEKFSATIENLAKTLTPYSETLKSGWKMKSGDDAVLGGTDIKKYLSDPMYSEFKTLAVQSSILRDKYLIKYIKQNNNMPVFISSKSLCLLKNVSETETNSLFNYLLLKNIEPNLKIEYKATMDYNSPIYMDIYGDIITESGYVVVPAMANATLNKIYNPYTAAFIGSYGKVYKAPSSYKMTMEPLADIMQLSDDEKEYEFKTLLEGDVINFQHFSPNSENVQKRLYNLARASIEQNNLDVPRMIVNVILEVMRGAPLEYIDKEKEGLIVNAKASRAGVVQAVKLDMLKSALKTNSQNSVIAIPNLAFMTGVEYVILFIYKITMLVVIVLIFIQIFAMAMTGSVNIFSIGKIILTIILTMALVFVVPVIYETTYYQTNKALLQNETLYIAMLNLEKSESGLEIGMLDVNEPQIDTKLFLKMKTLNIPWTDLFSKVIYSSIDQNFSKIYSDYARSSMAYGLEGFQARGDGLYLDVQDLFDSSTIMFDPKFKTIYQYVRQDIPASFYSPYYVFLDGIVGNVNKYNAENDLYAYTSSLYKGGKLKSVGLIKDYLTSDSFMLESSKDNLHLRQIYDLEQNSVIESPFTPEDISLMQQSEWCNTQLTDEEVTIRIEKLNEGAKAFVQKNKQLLGRISDETFLKAMALDLAMEHNKLFGVEAASSLEIYDLSPDDLVRLSILPRDIVMKGSPYSYSRYIFENVGVVGIYAAAILDMVLFIGGWVKPMVTLGIFMIIWISIFVNKLVLRKETGNVKGNIRLIILLSSINLIYAINLKVSTLLPQIGLPPVVCLIALIVMHLIYISFFIWIMTIVTLHWRDLGNDKLKMTELEVREFLVGNSVLRRIEERRDNPTNKGWELYKMFHTKDKQRVYRLEREDEI